MAYYEHICSGCGCVLASPSSALSTPVYCGSCQPQNNLSSGANGNLQLLNADLRAHLRKCFDDEVKAVRKAFRGSKGQISIPETYLSSLVERMGSSRIAFMTDAGQFLTLLIILLFAAAMIAAQVPATRGVWRWPLWIALEFMFGIVPIVAFALRDKAIAIYEFYVASVIHAAVVHAAFSLSHAHPWFAEHGIAGQQSECDHAVCFAAAHGL